MFNPQSKRLTHLCLALSPQPPSPHNPTTLHPSPKTPQPSAPRVAHPPACGSQCPGSCTAVVSAVPPPPQLGAGLNVACAKQRVGGGWCSILSRLDSCSLCTCSRVKRPGPQPRSRMRGRLGSAKTPAHSMGLIGTRYSLRSGLTCCLTRVLPIWGRTEGQGMKGDLFCNAASMQRD